MQLFGVTSSRQTVAIFGLVWLALFLLGAFWLSMMKSQNPFAQRFACAISYAGLLGALGVYAFLAVVPDT